jgi:cupin fold WbuC family metalloprotein
LIKLEVAANKSARKRAHLNLHDSFEDPIQRICIAIDQESYIPPHMYPQKEKWEMIVAVKGRAAVLFFDELSCITKKVELGLKSELHAIQIPAGTWHSIVPLDPVTIIMKIKQGPYNPEQVTYFAEWAPSEKGKHQAIREWYRSAQVGTSFTS